MERNRETERKNKWQIQRKIGVSEWQEDREIKIEDEREQKLKKKVR